MNMNDPLNDEKFATALSDVVWQFHVYGAYGKKESKAVKALTKRAPSHTPEVCKEMFEISLNVLAATIEAVGKAPKTPKPGQEFSEYKDIDSAFVLKELRIKFPGQADELLRSYIGMVIHWYYMR